MDRFGESAVVTFEVLGSVKLELLVQAKTDSIGAVFVTHTPFLGCLKNRPVGVCVYVVGRLVFLVTFF